MLVAVLGEVEGRVEARLGVGFRVGGAMLGVEGRDSGFMSHLERFTAGLSVFVSSLFLFIPLAPSSFLSSSSLSPAAPSHGAGTTGGAPHCDPWVVAPGTVAAWRLACSWMSSSSVAGVMCLARARAASTFAFSDPDSFSVGTVSFSVVFFPLVDFLM